MVSYNYFGEKQGETSIYGWEPTAVYNKDGILQMAYVSRADTVTIESVQVFAEDLSSHTIRMPRDVFSVAVSGDKLFAFSANEIDTYSLDGQLERSSKIEEPITGAKQISNDLAVVWDANKSYLMQLG